MNIKEVKIALRHGDILVANENVSRVYGATHTYYLEEAGHIVPPSMVRKLVEQKKIVYTKVKQGMGRYKWNQRKEK